MQTIVIHPEDESTGFLKPIYIKITCTIIRGNCTKEMVYNKEKTHDRIIMLGHGPPSGLFAVGQFINEGRETYIIDQTFVNLLKEKK